MAENAEKKKIELYYEDVRSAISNAMKTSFPKNFTDEEELKFAESIHGELEKLNKTFEGEIDALEKSSEWEKLCVSFFGETNAGKSTLIEALRIIYGEESRLQQIFKNKKSLDARLANNNENYKKIVDGTEMLKDALEKNDQKLAELEKELENKKHFVSLGRLVLSCVITALIVAAGTLAVVFFLFKRWPL